MPTAQTFTALTGGNGLPSCPLKVDVSEFDYWTTFSGYNKSNEGSEPSFLQVEKSQQLAAKLAWNLREVILPFSSDQNSSYYSSLLVNGSDWEEGEEIEPAIEPQKRVCGGAGVSNYQALFGGFEGTISRAYIDLSIFRLYNGDTSDEDKFIGYGLGEMEDFRGRVGAYLIDGISSGGVQVEIGGCMMEPRGDSSEVDAGYVSLDGFHFVGLVGAYPPTNDYQPDLDLENLSAKVDEIATGDNLWDAQIESLDLYTYD